MKRVRVFTVMSTDQNDFERQIDEYIEEEEITPEDLIDIKYNSFRDEGIDDIRHTAMIVYKTEKVREDY